MFGRRKDEDTIRESTSNVASAQDGTINEADVLAALEGDAEAFKRLQSMGGNQPTQARIDQFLARGGPRLFGALRQVELMGIEVDPSSKFAQRLEQFEKDVEAATNGDLNAYLRLNFANGIKPSVDQIADFKKDGGPPLVPTLRQRELMGKTTDPRSQFGQRVQAWEAAMAAQFGQKPPGGTSPSPPGSGTTGAMRGAPSSGGNAIPDRGSAAPDRPSPSHGSPGGSSDTPGSSSAPEVVSLGSGESGRVGTSSWTRWFTTGVYKDGTLTITTTYISANGTPAQSSPTTLTGDAAAAVVAGAKELQAYKDAQQEAQAARDQAAREQQDKAEFDAAANDEANVTTTEEANAAAADATADPESDSAAALRNPEYDEGSPGTITYRNVRAPKSGGGVMGKSGQGNSMYHDFSAGTIAVDTSGLPPPEGVSGHALFGGDYGNPMYVEFVGGGLLFRVASSPDVDPDANAAGVPGTIASDGNTPPTGGHVPFGGDFGNPNDRHESGTGTPPKGDGHDPYE